MEKDSVHGPQDALGNRVDMVDVAVMVEDRTPLTNEEIGDVRAHLKCDVYLIVGNSKKHPLTKDMEGNGLVFQAAARNTTFNEWEQHHDREHWLDTSRLSPGYYAIETDLIQVGSMSAPTMAGILVPCKLDKKLVAEDLRRRFGSASVLLKEDPV